MKRLTGELLNERYGLELRQARYRQDGKWYHALEKFPAALFDDFGYLRFATDREYQACRHLQKGPAANQVHAADGISSIPGYQRLSPPPCKAIP